MIEILWAKPHDPLEGPVGEKGMQGAIGMQGEPGLTLTPEQRAEIFAIADEAHPRHRKQYNFISIDFIALIIAGIVIWLII